jgi:LPXTG-motif cell wall-anchored protein
MAEETATEEAAAESMTEEAAAPEAMPATGASNNGFASLLAAVGVVFALVLAAWASRRRMA